MSEMMHELEEGMVHWIALLAGVATLAANASCASPVLSEEFSQARQAGIVKSELIREASGIVASRRNPGVLWVHNDSGDAPQVFALDTHAELIGACVLRGARSRDWEDIAVGPGPDPNVSYLYVGDIGDNRARHPHIIIYRVAEPTVDPNETFRDRSIGPVDRIALTYPDGARDAETLLVDPLTRDIYIISKRALLSKVYRAAYPQSTSKVVEMERAAVMPWGIAVGGDVSPDGSNVIVRGPFNASLWRRRGDEPLWKVFSQEQTFLPLADEMQGEAICFDRDGRGYFTIGEMVRPPLFYFAAKAPRPSAR